MIPKMMSLPAIAPRGTVHKNLWTKSKEYTDRVKDGHIKRHNEFIEKTIDLGIDRIAIDFNDAIVLINQENKTL